jgi:hypothetical protein
MASFIFEKLDDAHRHSAAIERLAAYANVSVDYVRPLYEKVLADLLETARITTYLSIFTARRVEALINRIQDNNSWPNDGTGLP